MNKKELIDFLKNGQSMSAMKSTDSQGGFLVPATIGVPAEGYINSVWRFAGRLLFVLKLPHIAFIVHEKGCKQVNTVEYLQSRLRRQS